MQKEFILICSFRLDSQRQPGILKKKESTTAIGDKPMGVNDLTLGF